MCFASELVFQYPVAGACVLSSPASECGFEAFECLRFCQIALQASVYLQLTLWCLTLGSQQASSRLAQRANEIGHDLLPWLCAFSFAARRQNSLRRRTLIFHYSFVRAIQLGIYLAARADPDKAER
jgi:hypothetical protein